MPAQDRSAILEKVGLLPAWADNRLDAANLDVRVLEGAPGFYRLRVGDYRVVFHRFGMDIVLHRVGIRDGIYDDLESLVVVRSGNGLRILQPAPEEPAPQPTPRRPTVTSPARAPEVENPLSVFANQELASAGLSSDAIALLRTIPAQVLPDEALGKIGIETRLIRLVAELWERPEHYLNLLREGASLDDELVRLGEEEAAARVKDDLTGASLMSISDMAQLAALLDRPIEDWMVYLHPLQSRAVDFTTDAPVRVRGAAGTGKTVVALHRARRLAEAGDRRVLLTTFVKNLPKVWGGLFETFAPDVRRAIDMRTVDSLGIEIYTEGGGGRMPIDDGQRRAIVKALQSTPAGRDAGLSAGQLEDEFNIVLDGRGIGDVDQYLALPRTGRGSRLTATARRAVWNLYERFRERLAAERLIGWEALRLEALRMLENGTVSRDYAAVVVDEAQDLTEASMRLLIALAGGGSAPRLTVVGDGQQSIYPGGFSLRSLGVEVRGRSMVLRTNWRNTLWIWRAAQAFIADEQFDDLEDEEALERDPTESPYPLRMGRPARLHLCEGGEAGEAETLALLIAEDIYNGLNPADCAALHPIHRGAEKLLSSMKALDVPVAKLERYVGRREPTAWVGTFHRAKGLEFKHVYIAGLAGGRWPLLYRDLDETGRAEERARQVRAAFVAMTRARDTLDIVCGGRVPAELERTRWAFDE
jgi:hypothetical protein